MEKTLWREVLDWVIVQNNPVNLLDPSGLISWNFSGGYGGTLALGWGEHSIGVSLSGAVNIADNGRVSLQLNVTDWQSVYGAYLGWGRQAGGGVSRDCPTPGYSDSLDQPTTGGGAGWVGSGEIAIITGRDNIGATGGGAVRGGGGWGAYVGQGVTHTFQYTF